MEHFRIILAQQKEALTKDAQVITDQILEKELELEKLKEEKKETDSLLRAIGKKLEKL